MKTFLAKEQVLQVTGEVDVLVVGAGPAGFAAAICAAREGAKTMLIEQSGDVGGIATAGLMSHWTGNTRGGFYEELLDRSSEMKTGDTDHFNGGENQIINPELLKNTMLEMLCEAGVNLCLYTFACEAIVESNVVKGAIIQNKSGRQAIFAKVVIDASGDGDIAASAGAEYTKGRESDGKMQPVTIMFKVAGVDYARGIFPGGFEETVEVPMGEIQALGREYLQQPAGHVLLYKTTLPGIVTCNMTNCIDIDGTNAEDLTRATYICRKQIPIIIDFLRAYAPGFENCYLISSASLIGVRETRHFTGEKTITEDDILQARIFDDWVVTKAHFNFDIHNLDGSGLDKDGQQQHFSQSKGYTIPYGCLVPKKVDGLLLAGRNISGTHKAHSNYRVMPICANMGQAAGIAAAICAKQNIQPRLLAAKQIQTRLIEEGVSV